MAPTPVEEAIRLGGDHDGGYILPRRIVTEAHGLISMGIGPNWRFERDVFATKAMPIHAYDHTVSAQLFRREFFAHLASWPLDRVTWDQVRRRWHRWRDYVAFFGSQATHFQQRIGHGGVWFTEASLRLPHDPILAKIDIDGAEYDIMDEIVMEAAGLTGLCIEVHDISQHLHVLEYWVGAMQARGLLLVHVHANNFTDGECVELTFARGSLVSRASQVQNLDQPNDPTKPEYRLVFDR